MQTSTIAWLTTLGIGIFIALLPVTLMFLSWAFTGFRGDMMGEGGHSVFLWYMMISLPIGGVVGAIGGIGLITNALR
ncbi:MAG: hypothetical protein JNM27_03005 [Leptospirales bacterium]|nr:hypothetical protein [Leptospirales bacterium]